MTDLFRREPFRLAIGFTIAVTLATLIGVGLIYRSVSSTVEMRRQMMVADETAAILDENQSRLRGDLQTWLRHGLLLYSVAGLFDQNGVPLAGNLRALPPNLPLDGRVRDIVLPPDLINVRVATDVPEEVMVAGTRRADGSILVLGRTLTEVTDLRRQVTDLGLFGISALLLVSLGFGLRVSVAQNRRLKRIQTILAQVMAGALGERLPVAARADDLDRLAHGVNRMLDMIETLVFEVKGVGDNIAHDLRTPLSVMRTRLERAMAAEPDAAALQGAIAGSLASLDRALASITALLRLAEIENGQRRAGFQILNLARLCRDAVEFYQPLAEQRDIRLTLSAPDYLPLLGDADLLVEALTNLVDNAVKFTPDGGTIAVEANQEGGVVSLSVADTGPGIPAEERQNVGKRFYRADKSRQTPGSGLGLSLVRAIAELHDFTLLVGDNLPSGTIVTLSRTSNAMD